LGGFGDKKKEKRGSSKKLLRLSENDLKAESINNHIKGNIDYAEKGYITFINNGFYDADVYSNYALICESKGETNKAIKLYERCINSSPNHIFAKLNLSFLYYKFNDLKKAILLIDDAIKLKPKLANAHSIKGLILRSLSKYNEAKASFEKAIEIDNNYFDAYINLGLLNKDNNYYDDAEQYYLKAISINNKSAIAYLNLGVCYKEKLEIDKALIYTQKAISLDSKLKNSYLNLATIYNQKGDFKKSLSLAKKELILNHDNELCYQLICDIIKRDEPLNISKADDKKLLLDVFNRKDISHRELFGTIHNLVPNNILAQLENSKSKLFENKDFNILIKEKTFLQALSLLIFCSPLWEKVLRSFRKYILLNYSDDKPINKHVYKFLIALGSQCFLNEYVYYVSEKEHFKLKVLKKSIKSKNIEYKLALISCYQSLASINHIFDFNNYKSTNKDFNNLLNMQVREIMIEENISKQIEKRGTIDNCVSKEVKNQYESNPYPRWRYNSYAKEGKVNFLSVINTEIYPNKIDTNQIRLTSKKLNILIAGCGTGIQIIEASRYSNCEITAIDLSNSSISYAKRKVNEYGMKNVNFIEMDLLELTQLDKRFDLIECSGVLHHMQDPSKGLSNLVRSLEPKGFLKLGLYSKYARQEIQKARAVIKEKELKTNIDEIRKFRSDVINGDINNLNKITNWSDFYSTSMCRDLCFHSQEKCYSLIEVKSLIEKANLKFLGFILAKDVKDKFLTNYKETECVKDLHLWDKFEKANPNSFREMYQFWTRKSIK
tara:strand:- start:760 stop:3093 length:2334 start_codon:yes stop_codon:yes gene_type:complete